MDDGREHLEHHGSDGIDQGPRCVQLRPLGGRSGELGRHRGRCLNRRPRRVDSRRAGLASWIGSRSLDVIWLHRNDFAGRRSRGSAEVGDGQQRRELGSRDVDEVILMVPQNHSLV